MSRFKIIFEDEHLLIIDKPSGLLTVGNEKSRGQSLIYHLNNYLGKKTKGKAKAYTVHRLDKQVSGLVLFAKSIQCKEKIQTDWHKVKKTYLAICEGEKKIDHGWQMVKSELLENKQHKVYSLRLPKITPAPEILPTSRHNQGPVKEAITLIKSLKLKRNRQLFQIHLITGRKNQIRCHLSELGLPILGDRKYGSRFSLARVALHSSRLIFQHPISQEELSFQSPLPKECKALI